jgi:DNA-nicking Smr family endonuclease
MKFGELLEQWERLSARPGGLDAAHEAERQAREQEASRKEAAARESAEKRREASRISLESWLASHPVEDKDAASERGRGDSAEDSDRSARRIDEIRSGARLDLHGKTVAESELALGLFLEDAARRGIEKVLVITGKGNHSAEGPVLGKAVRRFLEANPRAGRFGQASKSEGGAGALWVMVRLGSISRGK